ncbi:MAG: VCBS repeat-containing protein [Verrucomicrobiota bacterium]
MKPIEIRSGCLGLLCVVFLFACVKTETASEPDGTDEPGSQTATEPEIEQLEAVPGFDSNRFAGGSDTVRIKIEARGDADWDTEVFSEEAAQQLNEVAKILRSGSLLADRSLFSPALTMGELRPKTLTSAEQIGFRVSRGRGGSEAISEPEAIENLLSPFPSNRPENVAFKIVRVTPIDKETADADILYHASRSEDGVSLEQNATWKCRFTRESPPRLESITVIEFEEVASTGLRFTDKTKALLGQNPSFRHQLSTGIDHWRSRLQVDFGIDVNGLQGLALGDANGDGLDDLYVCQQGGLPNLLYLREPDGTLTDHSDASGANWMELTRAALFIDLDNDGDQDLALAQDWYLMLMENDGQARFTKRVEKRTRAQLRSLAAADVDHDGHLDLFFCGRNPDREKSESEGILGIPVPYHDANNGGPNVFLRQTAPWGFEDQTVALGFDTNNRRYSYACSWEDFDNDGDQDLYVANDFGRNNLYRNDLSDGGTFRDVAGEMGVEDISAGMSVTWGDPNRDGLMDLYVSNMFSSAGNRITYQRQFRSGETPRQLGEFQRHARGNTLFVNNGNGFEDASIASGVTMGRWAWGAKFADLNNDGWEDLHVANGFITTADTGDL